MKTLINAKSWYFIAIIFLSFSVAAEQAASQLEKTVVIGHLNPDPDSIGGAIAAAYYFGGSPARTGAINKESRFLLDFFKAKAPAFISDFKDKNIIAVDFNQKSQAPPSIADGTLIRVIDHHALLEAPITSEKPIPVEITPWGSVCTVIAKNYFVRNKREIPTHIAGMLLGGIISDTLNLRSETTTKHDREMVKHLAEIAGIPDVDALAFKMFKAKSDVSDMSDKEVLEADFKEFSLGNKKVGIGVAETVMPEQILERKEGLIKAAQELKKKDDYDYIFFFVVDIDKIKSKLILAGEDERNAAESAFGGKAKDDILDTRDLVSRKLQIGPILSDYFTKKQK